MLRLKKQGKTVLTITHRIGAAEVADKVILPDKGQLISEGLHSDLIRQDQLYKAFWANTLATDQPETH